MRVTLKSGIIFAFGWILIKLSMFGMGVSSSDSLKPSVLLNMLFLILAVTVGLYLQKRKDSESGNVLKDIKNGMTAGLPYAILVSLFIYIYYAKVDPDYIQGKLADTEVELTKVMKNPKEYKKLKDSNPDFEVMNDKQITKAVLKNSRSAYNPKSTAIMALSAMILYALLNSIFITVILRKLVFKQSQK